VVRSPGSIIPKVAQFPTYEFEDNLTNIRGKHNFKAGIGFRRVVLKNQNAEGIYPTVSFGIDNGNVPGSIGPTGRNISTADREKFENLYNDLLGRMEKVTQTFYSNLQTYSRRVRRAHAIFLPMSFMVLYRMNGSCCRI